MSTHESINLPHRDMRICARSALACIDSAVEYEEKLDYMMTEDILASIAEDCEEADSECNELLERVYYTPLGSTAAARQRRY